MPKKLFKKGEIHNPKGRGKGTLNKVTADVKKVHQKIIDHINGRITEDQFFLDLSNKELLNYLAKTVPKDINVKAEIKEKVKYSTKERDYVLKKYGLDKRK